MRRLTVVLLAVLVALVVPHRADAWGFEVHKYIMDRAIRLLPTEIRPFFEKYQVAIVEHAIDPDLWRTEEIYKKLVEAFTQKGGYSRDNIKFFSSIIAHYTSDAHVPFHAALNYDGQLSGQWGIHSRFESELFERYKATLQIAPKGLVPVANPREFIFDTLTASFPFVQPVLDADKAAVAGRDVYDDGYFALFVAKTQPILETRLSDAITGVASMITSAWIEAGRPALPLDAVSPPRKVRKQ